MGDLPRPLQRKAKGSARKGKAVLWGRRKGPGSGALIRLIAVEKVK